MDRSKIQINEDKIAIVLSKYLKTIHKKYNSKYKKQTH